MGGNTAAGRRLQAGVRCCCSRQQALAGSGAMHAGRARMQTSGSMRTSKHAQPQRCWPAAPFTHRAAVCPLPTPRTHLSTLAGATRPMRISAARWYGSAEGRLRLSLASPFFFLLPRRPLASPLASRPSRLLGALPCACACCCLPPQLCTSLLPHCGAGVACGLAPVCEAGHSCRGTWRGGSLVTARARAAPTQQRRQQPAPPERTPTCGKRAPSAA